MHSLRSAAVQYTNYGTGGAFELPTQSGTYNSYNTITRDMTKYVRSRELCVYFSHIPCKRVITIKYITYI